MWGKDRRWIGWVVLCCGGTTVGVSTVSTAVRAVVVIVVVVVAVAAIENMLAKFAGLGRWKQIVAGGWRSR
jgi:hypothetical protein